LFEVQDFNFSTTHESFSNDSDKTGQNSAFSTSKSAASSRNSLCVTSAKKIFYDGINPLPLLY